MVYRREILARGGDGGDGCVSFRREKHVPFGGPDGGDGGDGGSVIIRCDPELMDLSTLGHRQEFGAEGGERGRGGRKRGRNGKDLVISVPVGTMVFSRDKLGHEVLLADLQNSGEKVWVARGGRGGLGNTRFATAVNQAPKVAGRGEPGEQLTVVLEVKLVTDICILGLPNSGKSTLLSAISRARPEIADYPFTTRRPVLAVVSDGKRDFIVAEIPAIVAGAHLGKGLGNDFLRHIHRAKVLIYLLDGSSPAIEDDLAALDQEVSTYPGLAQKRRIVAVNKVDLPEVRARLSSMKQSLAKLDAPFFFISALDGQAVVELTRKAIETVQQVEHADSMKSQVSMPILRPQPRKKK